MKTLLAIALSSAAVAFAGGQPAPAKATIVLDNARVRAYRVPVGGLGSVEHRPGVVVVIADGGDQKKGNAYWAPDAAGHDSATSNVAPMVIVVPKDAHAGPPPASASKPGDATFTGMSFKTLFENDKVTAIRARMEEHASEAFHTHASDTIVVHLSGGSIEDTANGKTVVNHWKPGDVEFESLGSSHSARNVGPAVDVVLVALKP